MPGNGTNLRFPLPPTTPLIPTPLGPDFQPMGTQVFAEKINGFLRRLLEKCGGGDL